MIGAAWCIGMQWVFASLALGSADSAPIAFSMAVAVACQLALIVLCLLGARRPLGRAQIALGIMIGSVGVVAGSSLVWIDNEMARSLQLMVPTTGMQSLQLFVVATVARVRWAVVTVVLCAVAFLGLSAGAGFRWESVEQWSGTATMTLAVAFFLVYLRAGSTYAERIADLNRAAIERTLVAQVHERARAEARRVIHDDVIAALRAVEQAVPEADCRRAAAEALTELVRHQEVTSRAGLAAAVVDAAPIAVDLVDEGWPSDPPARVLGAMNHAAAEAVRNAARHAGVDSVVVWLGLRDGMHVVEVRDSGRGITTPGDGFGTNESIRARMTDVAGGATIGPASDGGTVVTLSWSAPAVPVKRVTPFSAHARRRGYLPAACLIALDSSFLAWRHPGPHPFANLALAAVMALVLPSSAVYFARHPGSWRSLPVVVLGTCGATALGVWLSGPQALLDYRGWIIGMASAVAMLFCFEAPLLAAAGTVVALDAVIVVGAALDPSIGILEPVGALTTAVVSCGFSAACGALLRRGTRLIGNEEAVFEARLADEAWVLAQQQARTVHLAAFREDLTPFLEEAAAGRPADRGRAGILVAQCRDLLLVGRSMTPELRTAVDAARARGTRVTFRINDDEGVWPAELDRATIAVLALDCGHVVTVFPEPDARVVVIPAMAGAARRAFAEELGASVALSGDAVRSVVRLSSDETTSARATAPVVMGR
jgi:hypothetical protein